MVLAAALGGTVAAGLAAGVGGELRRAALLGVPLAFLVVVVNALVSREGETLLVRGGEILGWRLDITLEALAYGGVAGLRVLVLVLALALFSAVVDPDDTLRLFRRLSYRSALTASLATRLVPVLARDAGRMSDAARCRPTPPPVRPWRGRRSAARWIVRWRWPQRSSCGATRAPGGRRRARAPWSRHDVRVAAATALVAAVAFLAAISEWGASTPTRRSRSRSDRPRRCSRRRCCACPCFPSPAPRPASGWPVPEPVLRPERFAYRYPAPRRRRSRTSHSRSSRASLPRMRRVRLGQVDAAARGVRARPALPRRRGRRRAACGGLSVREHGPSDLAAVCGTLLQDPETQVVMSGVHAEIALALEHRGEPPSSVARGVEEVALALGIGELLDRRIETLSGGELQRVALAAALAPRPALLVLDEPTSQLDPVAGDELMWLLRRLNEDWATTVVVAEHRVERCLPAADRVMALAGGRVASDGSPPEFLDWAADRAPGLLPPAARLFSLAGLWPLPCSVKEARAALDGAALTPEAPESTPQDAPVQPEAAGWRASARVAGAGSRRHSPSTGSGTSSTTVRRSSAAWTSASAPASAWR